MRNILIAVAAGILSASISLAQDTPVATPDKTEILNLSADKTIELDYYFPDDFIPGKPYPVILAPGSFFLQDDPSAFGWVVIRAGIGDPRFNADSANAVLDHLMTIVVPRGGKFHMMGYSANSSGVFRIVAALHNRFAGILTIPGHPRRLNEYEALKQMKIRFIVGERDGYWLREAKKAHAQFQKLVTDTEIEIIKNGGHVLRHLAGAPLFKRIDRWFR